MSRRRWRGSLTRQWATRSRMRAGTSGGSALQSESFEDHFRQRLGHVLAVRTAAGRPASRRAPRRRPRCRRACQQVCPGLLRAHVGRSAEDDAGFGAACVSVGELARRRIGRRRPDPAPWPARNPAPSPRRRRGPSRWPASGRGGRCPVRARLPMPRQSGGRSRALRATGIGPGARRSREGRRRRPAPSRARGSGRRLRCRTGARCSDG